MKYGIWAIIILILLGVGGYYFLQTDFGKSIYRTTENKPSEIAVSDEVGSDGEVVEEEKDENSLPEGVIGVTSSGEPIEVKTFGTGSTDVLLVAGLHGGYSWNTILLAEEVMTYFAESTDVIPEDVTVHVVAMANPDGVMTAFEKKSFSIEDGKALGEGERAQARFNSNNVDLNRNFDCKWQSTGVWRDTEVDAGDAPFSELETQALKKYIEKINPDVVVAYFSASGDVVASNCDGDILAETKNARDVYAKASGYTAKDTFGYYETTGDFVDWLRTVDVPAISVVLSTSDSIEWEKNKAGIEALLNLYKN